MSNLNCLFRIDAMFYEFRYLAKFAQRARKSRGTNFYVIRRYPNFIDIGSFSLTLHGTAIERDVLAV